METTTIVMPEYRQYDVTWLEPADRCDRCGAQAWAAANVGTHEPLLFCGHHFRLALDSLMLQAKEIHDFTPALHATEKKYKG